MLVVKFSKFQTHGTKYFSLHVVKDVVVDVILNNSHVNQERIHLDGILDPPIKCLKVKVHPLVKNVLEPGHVEPAVGIRYVRLSSVRLSPMSPTVDTKIDFKIKHNSMNYTDYNRFLRPNTLRSP